MFKNKLMLPILAVIVGIAASAFTTMSQKHTAKSNARAGMYYFQFVGTHNQDESDINQWDNISKATYDLLTCSGSNSGCKIEVNDTVHVINGTGFDVRPKGVDLVPGTNNPTLGTYIQDFQNFQ